MAKRIHPYFIIIISFVGVILLGTISLAMPFAQTNRESMGFVDSLFMATSAVCVTGLSVKNLAIEFSVFGKVVMGILMEIGGLSFITIAIFFFSILGGKIGVSNTFLLREALNQNSTNGMIKLVRKIVIISFTIQIICAAINVKPFYDVIVGGGLEGYQGTVGEAIGISVFHSAAAFNNAGFDILGANSMIGLTGNVILNMTTIILIVLGGIGFIVIDDIIRHRRWSKLQLHSKLVIVTTILLMFGGMLLIKLTTIYGATYIDPNTGMEVETQGMNWMEALFTSVTCRTAGFATYDMGNLAFYPGAYIFVILLMMIGASPCSTGGGVKTTTFAMILITIYYYSIGKKTKVFKRSINSSLMVKSFVLVAVAMIVLVLSTIIVSVAQPNLELNKVFFEVASAFSTTGLSMGITTDLNAFNRLFLCFVMLFGRLGPLTVIGVVNKNWMASYDEAITYPEENVVIG